MSEAKAKKHDLSESEDNNSHDEDSSTEESLDDYGDNPGQEASCPQRKKYSPRIKDESRRFFLFHAIFDQVLSIEAYRRIDWVKIAAEAGFEGLVPSQNAYNLFHNSWKALHGGTSFVQGRENKGETESSFSRSDGRHVHLLLAIIDHISGRAQKPTAKWEDVVRKLGLCSAGAAGQRFCRLWKKYKNLPEPDSFTGEASSRSDKMEEYFAYMESFDDGDDDEEPRPLYELHDSSGSKTERQDAVSQTMAMDLVPKIDQMDLN
ncbi:hypothetical protein EG329_009029 [Mollisiaceae sp. DMI_Dod_QoI]|nr:hypothetical protein EG329_009029 [Helotiales sp. DMI_Dod_QoI]